MKIGKFISMIIFALSATLVVCAGEVGISEHIITPVRVINVTGNVTGTEVLTTPFSGQVAVNDKEFTTMRSSETHTASILLDFGKEIHGGLKISAGTRTNKQAARLRITYGESVSEAMSVIERDGNSLNPTNDHAVREFTIEVPWLGSVTTGNSGFRFARIDLIDTNIDVRLRAIEAVSRVRNYMHIGTFRCSDDRLNRIWEAATYTLQLNMQEYIWDGIKRDRLVWLGDLNPEIVTACTVFGNQSFPLIHRSLDFGRDGYPLPQYINDMSSYSLWWIINQWDLYMYEGNNDYLKEQLPYVNGLVKQFTELIDAKSGAEKIPGGFLDWPTSRLPEVIHAGMQSLALMAMECASKIGECTGDNELVTKANAATQLLRKHQPDCKDNTQALSLNILSGLSKNPEKDALIILQNGLNQYSTFFGYYTSQALAQTGHYSEAMKNISDYWGAMLDLGATTFWEDLNYGDVSKACRIDENPVKGMFDIHSDGGDYCYKGLRLSLCHGWASGPAAWLIHHVLGVSPATPGCTSVNFKPNLGYLDYAEGTFPTPQGEIRVKLRRLPGGNIDSSIEVPHGVKIVGDY